MLAWLDMYQEPTRNTSQGKSHLQMNQQSFINTNGVQTQTYNNMKYILVTSKWPNPSKPSDKKKKASPQPWLQLVWP
jgi:hypothetical protein